MGAKNYEDKIDVVGEVRTADLDQRTFVLLVNGSGRILGHFETEHEALLTEALKDHDRCRLRVLGRARFNKNTAKPEEFVEVESLSLIDAASTGSPTGGSTWERISKIAAYVSEEELNRLPRDFVQNANVYLDQD